MCVACASSSSSCSLSLFLLFPTSSLSSSSCSSSMFTPVQPCLPQVANIGPIIFLIIAYCLAKTTVPKLTLDKVTSYLIMLVGVASTLLLAFLWKRTEYFWGSERSVALLTLSFFLCVMDCTSSVAYVAFMAALRPVYLSSFFIGEGLSGLLPALLALAQGAGDIVCVNGSSTEVGVMMW